MSEQVHIGYEPRRWQADLEDRLQRFNVLVIHRRAGKTVFALAQLCHEALAFDAKRHGQFGYVAPFRTQAKSIAWKYLKQMLGEVNGVAFDEVELRAKLPNGAEIRLYGADNPDSLRGLYLDGVVMDEVAQMRPETWDEVIRPALSDRKGWAIFIGTPKGINLFSELYERATKPGWFRALMTVEDTGAIEPGELRSMMDSMGPNKIRQELYCDFAASAEDALIAIDLINEAAGKHIPVTDYRLAPKVIGVDVARFGDDTSVICKRQGRYVHELIVLDDIDNMALASRVAYEAQAWDADAIFVDAGRGEGVIDRLRQLDYQCTEVNFGGRPANPRYANKRSEMYGELAEALEAGLAIPDDPLLKNDLAAPTYKFDASGRMALEPKEKMRERGLRSPDRADAVALTYAYPVAPKLTQADERLQPSQRVQVEYDPFE